MKTRMIILLFAVGLVATACGGDDGSDTTSAPTTTTAPTEAPTTTVAPAADAVSLTSGSLGDYLVDGAGNTLYLFVPDAQGESTCYDGCAEAWPPLTTEVTAGSGIDGTLLGTTARTDGTTQITYNGWPLYYFAADGAVGDTNGQGVNDVWFVVDAAGDAIGVGS